MGPGKGFSWKRGKKDLVLVVQFYVREKEKKTTEEEGSCLNLGRCLNNFDVNQFYVFFLLGF